MKRFIRFWLPVLLWMAVIFAFSSRTKIALTDSYTLSFLFFKTLHLIEYAFLYIVIYRAFRNTGYKTRASLYALVLTIIYAATDELHQHMVPTREGRLRDVIIDAIGGGIGWILIHQLLPILPKPLMRLAKHWQLI